MKATDRVRMFDVALNHAVLGTVLRVSPAGYVVVQWDDVDGEAYFSPKTAESNFEVVTGDAALPRHDWTDGDLCCRCLVAYGAERADEPCHGQYPDGAR